MRGDAMAWPDVLDAMEEHLERAERVLAGEDLSIEPFVLPSRRDRLPADLAGRARELLDATLLMEQLLEEAMTDMAVQMASRAASPAWPADNRPAPSYFDRTA